MKMQGPDSAVGFMLDLLDPLTLCIVTIFSHQYTVFAVAFDPVTGIIGKAFGMLGFGITRRIIAQVTVCGVTIFNGADLRELLRVQRISVVLDARDGSGRQVVLIIKLINLVPGLPVAVGIIAVNTLSIRADFIGQAMQDIVKGIDGSWLN